MELWIRSQDKETLIKVDDVFIEKHYYIDVFNVETNNCVLGSYKSRERALEILDEIQGLLVRNDKVVYEMPKE